MKRTRDNPFPVPTSPLHPFLYVLWWNATTSYPHPTRSHLFSPSVMLFLFPRPEIGLRSLLPSFDFPCSLILLLLFALADRKLGN